MWYLYALTVINFVALSLLRSHVSTYNVSNVLFGSEFLKFIFFLVQVPTRDVVVKAEQAVIPMVGFCVTNVLSFTSTQYLSASTYALIMQFKLLTTMLLTVLCLHKRYSVFKMLTIISITLSSMQCLLKDVRADAFAVMLAFAEVCISSLINIFSQYTFDNEWQHLCRINLQMSIMSMIVYGAGIAYSVCTLESFDEPNGRDVVLMTVLTSLTASGGVLAAAMVCYSGAVTKTLVLNVSTILLIAFDVWDAQIHVSYRFVLSMLQFLTTCSMYAYIVHAESRAAVMKPEATTLTSLALDEN